MDDVQKTAGKPTEDAAKQPRSEDGPAESETARGNVHSRKHDEPEMPAPAPLPH